MKKNLSLLSIFVFYQLLSVGLSLTAITFLHFAILKNSDLLCCVTMSILMLIYIFTVNRLLNSEYIKNKFSIIILLVFNIFYYVVFFIKWLNMPLKRSGEADFGIGILIVSFNLCYLAIIIVSIISIILIPKRHK